MGQKLRTVRQIRAPGIFPEAENKIPLGTDNGSLGRKAGKIGQLQRFAQFCRNGALRFIQLFHEKQHTVGVIQDVQDMDFHGFGNTGLDSENAFYFVVTILLHQLYGNKPQRSNQAQPYQANPKARIGTEPACVFGRKRKVVFVFHLHLLIFSH